VNVGATPGEQEANQRQTARTDGVEQRRLAVVGRLVDVDFRRRVENQLLDVVKPTAATRLDKLLVQQRAR